MKLRLAALLIALGSIASAQVTFNVNETQGVSSISPYIYGINGTQTTGQNLTFERDGGNRWTAYNYTNNLSNAGSDYYYENDNYLGGGSTPGGAVLPLLQNAQANGAGALVTIPINGLVAEVATGHLTVPLTAQQTAQYFVPEYPTQAQDPAPASNHVYQNGFVQIAENAFKSNQPLAFDLDNEPDLWNSTHEEVHPQATTYAELLQKSVAYATMIKQIDPNALVYGPVSYGWEGFVTLQGASDSAADGDFLTWYLKNMATASQAAGVRLLDALDLHWYPEATGINSQGQAERITNVDSTDEDPGVVAARLQAPRSLWDSTYTEASWITQDTGSGPINLINREDAKINAQYPGTKLSFSEYNYGGGDNISGGVAEADVLGIFGKFGVYSANEWPSGSEPFVGGAFDLYRDYDGKDSTFGNTEVQANNTDTVDTSIYASVDSSNPNHLTLMAINKEMNSVTTTINLTNAGNYNTAAIYQLTSANSVPQFAGNFAVVNGTVLDYTMPAESASLISLLSVATQWNQLSGGNWNTSSDWSVGIPNGASADAVLPPGNSSQSLTLNSPVTLGTLVINNSLTYSLGGSGSLTMQAAFGSSQINVEGGTQAINVPVTFASNTTLSVTSPFVLNLSGGVTLNSGITVTPTGGGKLNYASNVSLQSGANLTMNNSSTLTGLTIGSGAKLDLTSSDLAINYANVTDPATAIRADLVSGYNSGGTKWTGTGITSSSAAANPSRYALGYADGGNSVDHANTGLAAGELEIEYTIAGDANLSGAVDLSDLVIIASDFGDSGADWAEGDLNYDGNVDLSDLVIVASNFGASLASVQASDFSGSFAAEWQLALAEAHGSDVSLPEPAALGFMMIGAGVLARRRQRRSARADSGFFV